MKQKILLFILSLSVWVVNAQIYNSNGTYTVPAGVTSIKVHAWGGGGNGGTRTSNSGGGGGGAGAYSYSVISVSTGETLTITIGAGGTAGATASNGGTTTVVRSGTTLVSANGGTGVASNITTGGAGGTTGGTGDTKTAGGAGANGNSTSGGKGGDSPNGGAGGVSITTQGNGLAGNAPGGGGGGALRTSTSTYTGGAGGVGAVIIDDGSLVYWGSGSRDLYPLGATGVRASLQVRSGDSQSFDPFPTLGTMYVYLKQGETLYLGSSAQGKTSTDQSPNNFTGTINVWAPDGTSFTSGTATTGLIADRTQELAGPYYSSSVRAGGYTPYTIPASDVTQAREGIWKVEFKAAADPTANGITTYTANVGAATWTQPVASGTNTSTQNQSLLVAFDISVGKKNDAGTLIPGRVFCNTLNMNMPIATPGLNTKVYVLTNVGYVYEVKTQDLIGGGFNFFSNSKGIKLGTDTTSEASYKSEPYNNGSSTSFNNVAPYIKSPITLDKGTDITHKIFFQKPASDMPQFATQANGTVTSDKNVWLRKPVTALPTIDGLTIRGAESNAEGIIGPDGAYVYFKSNVAGKYEVKLKFGDIYTDRILKGYCVEGTNYVLWDGKDGATPAISITDNASISVSGKFTAAEVHFPMFDVEANQGGTVIQLLNPADLTTYSLQKDTVYWDDTNITSTANNGASEPKVNSTGGKSSNENGHKWGVGVTNLSGAFGNDAVLDTWAYIPSNAMTTNVSTYQAKKIDLAVNSISASSSTVFVGDLITYTVVVENKTGTDYIDAVGAKFGFKAPVNFHITGYTFSNGSQTSNVETNVTGIGTNIFTSTLDIKLGTTVTYTITGYMDVDPGNVTAEAYIIRPPDVRDIDATSSNIGIPVDPYLECNGGDSGAGCNNIKTTSVIVVKARPAAYNDINQVPAGVTATGNILSNDSYTGTATITTPRYYNASGTLTALTLGLGTDVYTADGTLAGKLTLTTTGTYTFVPAAGFTGDVPVLYAITDDTGVTSNTASLTIKVLPAVNPGNNPPVAQNDTYTIERGQTATVNVLANDSDPDVGNTLSVTEVKAKGSGTATVTLTGTAQNIYAANGTDVIGTAYVDASGKIVFTPAPSFTGNVPFDYTISDGNGGTDTATATVTVLPNTTTTTKTVNAYDDYRTTTNTAVSGNVLSNDLGTTTISVKAGSVLFNSATVPLGTLTTLEISGTTCGSIIIHSDGSYTFTPKSGYTGTVPPITYTATDGTITDAATLNITVTATAENHPPIANRDVATVNQSGSVAVKPLSNDSDPDGNALTVTEVKAYTNTSGTPNAISTNSGSPTNVYANPAGTILAGTAYLNTTTNEVVFVAAATYKGTVPFSYIVSDGHGETATGTIDINVLGAPVYANDDAKAAPMNQTITISNLMANDTYEGATVPKVSQITYVSDATGTKTTVTVPSGTTGTTVEVYQGGVKAGTVKVTESGELVFTPVTGFVGTVPVEYTLSNGTDTDKATAYLTSLPQPITQFWVGSTNDNWNTGSNWKSGNVPNAGDNITFATAANNGAGGAAKNDLVVPASQEKTIGNLVNESDKALVIPPGTGVVVTGSTITGYSDVNNPNRLVIEADGDATAGYTPNGSFIVSNVNPCSYTIYGTVQLYAKGYKGSEYSWEDNIDGSPTKGTIFKGSYHWQFFGVPVESIKANPTFAGSFLRKYNEKKNATDSYYNKWETLNNDSELTDFTGYSITQDAAKIIEIKGALTLCDKTLTLTHQAPEVAGSGGSNEYNKRYGLGQNVFGNSFTAALPVNNIEFPIDGSVEKTVYLYNTASFGVWGGLAVAGTQTGTNAGMYISIPVETAPVMGYANIPSMNGFLLRHIGNDDNDRQVTLKYMSLEKNTKPQTAPGRNRVAKEDLSYLEIELNSASTSDKLWMFSQEGTSDSFDNGWDGLKFFGTPTAFIYAPTPDGNMQVNTTSNLIGSYINFAANEDTEYTLTVKKSNIEQYYTELYLVDRVANTVTPLDKEEVTYKFIATNSGTDVKRFQIRGTVVDENQDNQTTLTAYVANGKLQFVNSTQEDAKAQLFDLAGKKITDKTIFPMTDETLQIALPSGIYLVKMSAGKYQNTVKVIVK
ncbi:MAG: tandem-95 repeat protein [Paludibacteraceae bacterium]